jgi:excisionase family DNA binding protein
MNNAVMTPTVASQGTFGEPDNEVLTVFEVARFLRVPKSTVYKMARMGELPASKIGKHWRFLRRDLHDWMHCRTGQPGV